MSNLTFKLNPDLRVSLQTFAFQHTYAGILEGNMKAINRSILQERVPERAIVLLFDLAPNKPWPIYVRQPKADRKTGRFPKYVCFALLDGPLVKGRPDSDDEWTSGSRVGYCWFTDEVDLRVSGLLAAGLEPFDWDKIAENWGI